jgi:hypothetical protein
MVNPHFNHYTSASEQRLVDDLIIEAIKIFGRDAIYIKREQVTTNLLLGEFSHTRFSNTVTIEMYPKDVTGWRGSGDLLSKFGMEIQDRFTFQVSKSRWEEVQDELGLVRPREGDLVYFVMPRVLLEIKFVEHEAIFYQTGVPHMYELQCEKFIYNQEPFDTDQDDVNEIVQQFQYAHTVIVDTTAGSGTYTAGEQVFQGVSPLAPDAALATVRSYDSTTGALVLTDFINTIVTGVQLVGAESSASYPVTSIDTAYSANTLVRDNATLNARDNEVIDFSIPNVVTGHIDRE